MTRAHHDLVELATGGERRAVETLFERHLPGLLAFVRLRAGTKLRRMESSVDLVQSACREVLQDLGAVAGLDEPHFRHWLYLAAERKIVDRARYHGRAKRGEGADVPLEAQAAGDEERLLELGCRSVFTPSRAAEAHEEFQRFECAFLRLSDEHREVIALSRIVGLPYAAIAEELGKSEGAVRVLLHRALARLASELGLEG